MRPQRNISVSSRVAYHFCDEVFIRSCHQHQSELMRLKRWAHHSATHFRQRRSTLNHEGAKDNVKHGEWWKTEEDKKIKNNNFLAFEALKHAVKCILIIQINETIVICCMENLVGVCNERREESFKSFMNFSQIFWE